MCDVIKRMEEEEENEEREENKEKEENWKKIQRWETEQNIEQKGKGRPDRLKTVTQCRIFVYRSYLG